MKRKLSIISALVLAGQIPLATSCALTNDSKSVVALVLEVPAQATITSGVTTLVINKGTKWSQIQLPEIEYKDGYKPDHWEDKDGNIITDDTTFEKTSYITLKVKQLSKIKVNFKADSLGHGTLDYTDIDVWSETKWSDVEKPVVFITTKGEAAAQRFNKWVDLQGNDIPEDTIVTDGFTAKASFEKMDSLKVTFESGDHGKFEDESTSIQVETLKGSRWWSVKKPFIYEDINYDVSSWVYKDTQEPVSINDEITGERTIVAKYTPNVKTSFASTSWKNIGKFANAYEYGQITAEQLCNCFTDVTYNQEGTTDSEKLQDFIGRKHYLHVDNPVDSITHEARIIGTAVDTIDDISATNKAAFSFEFVQLFTSKDASGTLVKNFKMNNNKPTTSTGGKMTSSNLWNNTLPTECYSTLDTDLQAVIKPVIKNCLEIIYSAKAPNYSYKVHEMLDPITINKEKIWLLGLGNIYSASAIKNYWPTAATHYQAYIDEEKEIGQYQYYQTLIGDASLSDAEAKKKLVKYNADNKDANDYWLNTKGYSQNYYVQCFIGRDGYFLESKEMNSDTGLCPCFSI